MQRQNKYYRQVQLLVRILPIIAEEPCFALKGGTALNLFLRDLPRLSVDIDLAYLPTKNRKDAIKEIESALATIAEKVKKLDVTLKIMSDNPCKLFVRLKDIQVKVEVNEVIRGSVHPVIMRSVSQRAEDEFGFAEMNLLSEHDLHAGKICAALDRQHPRDLFDIKYFLDNYEYTPELMDTFIVYLISHKRPINEVLMPTLQDITRAYENEFRQMADTPIPVTELLDARANMINSVQNNLSDRHKEFLLTFKAMKPRWELLHLDGVEHLPGVKWKMINLQRMESEAHKDMLLRLEEKIEGL